MNKGLVHKWCSDPDIPWGVDLWLYPVELRGVVDGKTIEVNELTGGVNLSLEDCFCLQEEK